MPAKRAGEGGAAAGECQHPAASIEIREEKCIEDAAAAAAARTQPAAGSRDHRQAYTREQKGICPELENAASLVLWCSFTYFSLRSAYSISISSMSCLCFSCTAHKEQEARPDREGGREGHERGKGKGERKTIVVSGGENQRWYSGRAA